MWSYEKIATVAVSRSLVWEWWTNVEKWPQWDTDLSEAALLGELAVGTQGKLKVADDALVSFVVAELIPEERIVISIRLFGATLSYVQFMTDEDGQLRITHGAQISGILSFVWRLLLKKKIEKTVGPALDALVAQVVAESARRAEIAAAMSATAPVEAATSEGENAPAIALEAAPAQPAATEAVAAPEEAAVPAGGGDPLENELRAKDMHTQIEVAAQAPEGNAAPVADAEHTAVVAVSAVITKKETKRTT